MRVQKTLIGSGLLLCGFMMSLPSVSFAASGCSNVSLNGTYNAQVENASFINVLNTIRAGATNSGTTTMPPPTTGGFGDNPNSLGGQIPGLGRYYFDGNGNIIGQALTPSGTTMNASVGTYAVNYDCTGTLRLNSGQTYNAVVANAGTRVLFMQTDSAGAGIVGSMDRSSNSCGSAMGSSQSYGFSMAGAQRVGVNGAAAGTTNDQLVSFNPYATLGSVTLNPDGSFSLRGWTFSNGSVQNVSSTGTYTLGFDCSLKFNFGSTAAAATPFTLRGILVDQEEGVLSVQPDNNSTATSRASVQ